MIRPVGLDGELTQASLACGAWASLAARSANLSILKDLFWFVGRDRLGARHPCAYVIGGIGKLGEADRIARPAAEQGRQPGDQLFGADGGQDRVRAYFDVMPAGEPAGRGCPQFAVPLVCG